MTDDAQPGPRSPETPPVPQVPQQAATPSSPNQDVGAVPPPTQQSTVPGPRMVSDDELLDADAKPQTGEPLFRLPSIPGSRVLRRIARGALALAAVATVAGAAGVATHSADVHRANDQQRNRSLLRLVGGGTAMSFTDIAPSTSGQRTTVQLQVSIRNDGLQSQVVTRVDLDAPGVEVTRRPAPVVIQPGKVVPIGLAVSVSCDRADLVERPRSVILQVQPNAAGASAGGPGSRPSPTDPSRVAAVTKDTPTADPSAPLPVAAPTGTPVTVTLPVSGSSGSAVGQFEGYGQTGSFYALCGISQLIDNGPVASYTGLAAKASATNPVIRFQIGIRSESARSGALVTEKPYQNLPGITVTGDLPAAATTLTTGAPVQAGLTVRVTDCAQLGTAVSAENGVRNIFEVIGSVLPLGSEPTDPRFRRPGLDQPLMLTGNVSAFEQDLLVNLVAACPGLK